MQQVLGCRLNFWGSGLSQCQISYIPVPPAVALQDPGWYTSPAAAHLLPEATRFCSHLVPAVNFGNPAGSTEI